MKSIGRTFTIESFFNVAVGDNLVRKLQVELLIKDGVIQEIRGEL